MQKSIFIDAEPLIATISGKPYPETNLDFVLRRDVLKDVKNLFEADFFVILVDMQSDLVKSLSASHQQFFLESLLSQVKSTLTFEGVDGDNIFILPTWLLPHPKYLYEFAFKNDTLLAESILLSDWKKDTPKEIKMEKLKVNCSLKEIVNLKEIL